MKDVIGMKFNSLTVVGEGYKTEKNRFLECLCECGRSTFASYSALRKADIKSCGCQQHAHMKTHELSDTKEYATYHRMLGRCLNDKTTYYSEYGGRGITVCDRWLEKEGVGFINFINDMGLCPKGHSLDRIDVNGAYSPENCRWADSFLQAYNKRVYKSNTSGIVGVTWIERDKKWSSRISVNGKRIALGLYLEFEDAVLARENAEIKYYGEKKNA